MQVVVTTDSVLGVTQTLEEILSDAPAEDQTEDNVAIVAGVLSSMLTLGSGITGEVCMYIHDACRHVHGRQGFADA